MLQPLTTLAHIPRCTMILKMREEDGCSWEEIDAALPHQTKDAIQVRYSTKLKKSCYTCDKHRSTVVNVTSTYNLLKLQY
ncbi:hypothetical protein BDZ45DRAFT_501146 [Acephala macrosclerotiorum]|nr:hypothetical protein BDZ45DRAFT_501146 [Acephala macrosclerotiorum]